MLSMLPIKDPRLINLPSLLSHMVLLTGPFDGIKAYIDDPFSEHVFQRPKSWGFIPESPPNHISMCRRLDRSIVIGLLTFQH